MRQVDPIRMAAWRRSLDAHAAVLRVLNSELEGMVGMPLSWYDVLVNLEAAPGGQLRMSELAERIVLSQSGLTRLIDRMAQAGLVERTHCDSDRRGRFTVLTEEGRQALHAAAPTHIDGVWRHFATHLSDEEAATLADVYARVDAAARDRSVEVVD